MALFKANETKEIEKSQKIAETMQRYGMNDLLNQQDKSDMENILTRLANNGGMTLGETTRAFEQELNMMSARYTMAIFEQNNIIIKQLDRLNHNLETKRPD